MSCSGLPAGPTPGGERLRGPGAGEVQEPGRNFPRSPSPESGEVVGKQGLLT
jgi:hypothetical protein